MKTGAIITELNPFTNGHKYIVDKIKSEYNLDILITIMSGNFTQRGIPSIVSKFEKTKMALLNGIDLVIELPLIYSISSANYFAYGATSILNNLSCISNIDYLFFGAESNLEELDTFANAQLTKQYEDNLRTIIIDKKISFAKAQSIALKETLNSSNMLYKSNDLLAVEYLKNLKLLNSNIKPIAIKRIGEYLSFSLSNNDNKQICSATAIRKAVLDGVCVKDFMPSSSYDILKSNIDNKTYVKGLEVFSSIIFYILRTINKENLEKIAQIDKALLSKILNFSKDTNDIFSLIQMLKSKNYTYAKLCRIMLYLLFNISKQDLENSKKVIPYAHVLGANDNGFSYLSNVNKCNKKIFLSIKDLDSFLDDDILKHFLNLDILATNIYTLGYENSEFAKSMLDYTNLFIKG